MLNLRRGRVVEVTRQDRRLAELRVEVDEDVGGAKLVRAAIAYPELTGAAAVGDEVIVNVEAQDLELGSGGFDIVCANVTSGLGGKATHDAHTMKLNYTPLQHSVKLLEEADRAAVVDLQLAVGVLGLHGQLAPAAFALSRQVPGAQIGYIQTAGGALPGALSNDVAELVERGLIAGHITAGPAFGGAHESATTVAALVAARERLGWDAALVGPGPGIQGSASTLGHGGMAALDSAHAALALNCEVVLVPRLSSGDPRPRHRGVSHHTETVLKLLLAPLSIALPATFEFDRFETRCEHEYVGAEVGELVAEYQASGLPTVTMGRSLDRDRVFFEAALAGGVVVAGRLAARGWHPAD